MAIATTSAFVHILFQAKDGCWLILHPPLTNVPLSFQLGRVTNRWNMSMMQHDPRLREAARAIYEACYPSDEWAQFAFDEAERYGTVHYRQAVDGALAARACLAAAGEQLALPVT